MQKLLATVKRALRAGETRVEARSSLANLGRSASIVDLRKRLAQLSQAGASLQLRGEPGVMPDLYARALQHPGTPWVNAASGLAESPEDLLGQAAGGILFVDDLAALSRLQQKNLAFIAARGERQKLRIVSFTAEDPRRLTDERGFDQTLLAQLSQLVLMLPALRQHAEDIPELAAMLLPQYVVARLCPPREFSTAALNLLRNFTWPRNLEELQQVVRSAALAALHDEIGVEVEGGGRHVRQVGNPRVQRHMEGRRRLAAVPLLLEGPKNPGQPEHAPGRRPRNELAKLVRALDQLPGGRNRSDAQGKHVPHHLAPVRTKAAIPVFDVAILRAVGIVCRYQHPRHSIGVEWECSRGDSVCISAISREVS